MTPRSILAYRFSSLGDVALTVPVLKTLEATDPDLKIYFATQPAFKGLFSTLKNVEVIDADIYGSHKGLMGIKKLQKECSQKPFDIAIDLHNTLRSKLLSTLLKLKKKKVVTYDKMRDKRKEFIKSKQLTSPLPHVTSLYMEAFRSVSNSEQICDGPWIKPALELEMIDRIKLAGLLPKTGKWICVAPFSKHGSKQWVKMLPLLKDLARLEDIKLFCMAFGEWETMIAKEWKKDIPGLYIISEGFTLEEQLSTIASMDAMVSMDSANMHLAALVGTPVVSIWMARNT